MAGGGALLPGMDRLIGEKTGIEVHIAEDPSRPSFAARGRCSRIWICCARCWWTSKTE